MKTEVRFTAILAVCMALASRSLAEPQSYTTADSTPAKAFTSDDIAALMHWELRKLPVTSATEDAREFLRLAKEHEKELPSRFDRLSQELEAKGIANLSDDISKGEYQKTWESIVKDTLEHSLNPVATPVPQPSPSVYYAYAATHAKPSATATVSAHSSSESGVIAVGGLFFGLAFLIGSVLFYFLPSIIAGSRHHHNTHRKRVLWHPNDPLVPSLSSDPAQPQRISPVYSKHWRGSHRAAEY
jgi:hypothetical protein